ncbi:uncharacterized protein LOC119112926 [Pollicipes pollicipes]|uniref:uncharacterized protein LOC119112926 n=1 Tax=Pollicipes pollicipes TaxID=41117 RepID=UPI0018849638|nr:uncharacterized protein LOC119112926 [Pollicipes pollicipes]
MADSDGPDSGAVRRRVAAPADSGGRQVPAPVSDGASGRRRRSKPAPPLLLPGLLFSVAVSGLLGWWLLRSVTSDADIDTVALASTLSDALVAQQAAVAALVAHLRRAQSSGAQRLDFLALGPVGTGKTLLSQRLEALGGPVAARRLVGGAEIGRDRRALDLLAADLLSAAAPGRWLLLALDDITHYVPEAVYLLEAVGAAAAAADVRLMTLVTATTDDLAGERGADAERQAFRHAHRVRLRPLRRAEVADCLRRFAAGRGVQLGQETVDAVLEAVPFEGQYAAQGCKLALYQLQTLVNLKDG